MDFELLTLLHKVSVKVISRRLAKRKYRYEIDTVDAEEFIEVLFRLKCGNNQTAATIVKRYVHHLKKQQNQMVDAMQTIKADVAELNSRRILGEGSRPKIHHTT